ncbi:hypothetical protein CVT26_011053 [Gymnopilus dilepis]|uniref:Clp1-like protein n=1 Tax=Gymnopilus dilepis TaxID=231916 RepID=A0A409VIU4_9AGAR|nr:hypothetical protein CVT26_011053 [Gymnopilus dilepis]
MIQAGHHNNKVNKIASGSHKSHARCTPATHLPFLRRSRQRRYTQHKMVKGSPLAPAQINGAVAPATAAAALSCAKLELPAKLERPVLQEVNIQNLRKACPELKDTPPSYVREKLQLLAPAMLVGLQSAQILSSKTQLPQELQVLMTDSINMAGVSPTHILAVASSRAPRTTPGAPLKVTLFPIHTAVFAANCSSFPLLPASSAATPEANYSRKLTIPVVRLAIPSPEAFPLLQTYLYHKDVDRLRDSLLPTNYASSLQNIVQRASLIKGLWMNGHALGVVDRGFWEVIEECWEEVIRSLSQLTTVNHSS